MYYLGYCQWMDSTAVAWYTHNEGRDVRNISAGCLGDPVFHLAPLAFWTSHSVRLLAPGFGAVEIGACVDRPSTVQVFSPRRLPGETLSCSVYTRRSIYRSPCSGEF